MEVAFHRSLIGIDKPTRSGDLKLPNLSDKKTKPEFLFKSPRSLDPLVRLDLVDPAATRRAAARLTNTTIGGNFLLAFGLVLFIPSSEPLNSGVV